MPKALHWSIALFVFALALLLAALPSTGRERPKPKPCPLPPVEGEEPAYRVIEVVDGGALSGRLVFEGEYTPKKWKVIKDKDFCGASVADESLVAAADGSLRFVAVYIDDIKEGKPLSKTVKEVANKDCLYQPHVETFTVCDKVMITNHDPILHNTHAYLGDSIFEPVKPSPDEDGFLVISEEDFNRGFQTGSMSSITTLFNIGLPTMDFKPKKTLRDPGLITLKCDAGHTWMTGFIIVSPHPYHAVSDVGGKYTIDDVPAGEYNVVFWHEMLGEQKHKVTIKKGETTTLDVIFKMK